MVYGIPKTDRNICWPIAFTFQTAIIHSLLIGLSEWILVCCVSGNRCRVAVRRFILSTVGLSLICPVCSFTFKHFNLYLGLYLALTCTACL